jgi:hypothetical protein
MKSEAILLEKPYERFTWPTEIYLPVPSIWKQPTYRFTLPESGKLQPYYFDVTDSAKLTETKGALATCLDWVIEKTQKRHPRILDFGAGRLRNSLYMLEKGHPVTAVEFEKLAGSGSVRPALDSARGFGNNFSELVFPHDFFASRQTFDLIMLVNVLNVIPVPAERSLVLQYCRTKLEDDGLIFWYSQTKQSDYIGKPKFADGLMSESHKFKTFYKDYSDEEIDELFASNGLRLAHYWEPGPALHVRGRLLKKAGPRNPTESVLDAGKVRRYVKGDKPFAEPKEVNPPLTGVGARGRPNLPDPTELSALTLYSEALPTIPAGNPTNSVYQNLIGAIFTRLFYPQLVELTFEKEFNEGRDRIDIVFRNHAKSGFFSRFLLRSSPFVYVECKNYSHDLRIGEINQSIQRVGSTSSHICIIACRHNSSRSTVRDRCRDFNREDDRNTLFWLEDEDILELLRNGTDSDAVSELLMQRVDAVTPT